MTLRITHYGHSCLLVETAGARVLVDPGNLSRVPLDLDSVDALAVTHQHPDHLDPALLPDLREAYSSARWLVEPETVAAQDLPVATSFAAGQTATVGDLTLEAVGGRHAFNHEWFPVVGNVGLVLTDPDSGMRLFHPGDSYDTVPADIDVLALPVNAPWCRISETLAFVRDVRPRYVVPIHDALLSTAGRGMYLTHLGNFSHDETEIRDAAESPLTL